MKRWLPPSDPTFTELTRNFSTSAWRLECQQIYGSDNQEASVAEFLSGQAGGVDLGNRAEHARSLVAQGRTKTNLRIVVNPPTLYTRWQVTRYGHLATAGEDIRILTVPQGEWPDGVPDYDFWIFDDRLVGRMHYFPNFWYRGCELDDAPEVVTEHRRARDRAMGLSVPLFEHYAAHPEAAPAGWTRAAS